MLQPTAERVCHACCDQAAALRAARAASKSPRCAIDAGVHDETQSDRGHVAARDAGDHIREAVELAAAEEAS